MIIIKFVVCVHCNAKSRRISAAQLSLHLPAATASAGDVAVHSVRSIDDRGDTARRPGRRRGRRRAARRRRVMSSLAVAHRVRRCPRAAMTSDRSTQKTRRRWSAPRRAENNYLFERTVDLTSCEWELYDLTHAIQQVF